MLADAVFEGGGVKGIGLVGAVVEAEARGYRWSHLAGTSAGAIVASLLAAGYTGRELARILKGVDYRQFRDPSPLGRVPLVGLPLSLLWGRGLYMGRAFEEWLEGLLAAKGVRTFGDLLTPSHLLVDGEKGDERYRYRLRVVASDLTHGRMLVLPQDIGRYGYDPDRLLVARAVRMSMSIPFFYWPVYVHPREGAGAGGAGTPGVIVDGGLLSNYPVWLFDSPGPPPWPTFGFRLVEPGSGRPRRITGTISLLAAMVSTMLEAHDARYVEEKDFVRTIAIPTLGVNTTDFDISPARAEALFNAGRQAAARFLDAWDFAHYVRRYRIPA